MNVVVCAAALVLLPIVMNAASFEVDALRDLTTYATMLSGLVCRSGLASDAVLRGRMPAALSSRSTMNLRAQQSRWNCGTAARVEIERPG